MNHTSSAPDSDGNEVTTIAPLANPRRTRIGADGRPITGPVTTSGN